MQELKDSLGNLQSASQPGSSESQPRLSEHLAGKLLDRLAANFGEPWGRDEGALRQMRRDWAVVLEGFTEAELEGARLAWMKTKDTWPKPANIRQLAADARPRAERQAWKAEPFKQRDPGADARMARMIEIRDKHKHSATPLTDTVNDPEYQAVLRDYTRATGRQPA